MLEARRVVRSIGRSIVLDHVSFTARSGECVVMTGDNGAGKTTLMRCLAGVASPDDGKVLVDGRPIDSDRAVRAAIGMVAHESRLYDDLTLGENLLFAARMYRTAEPRERVRRWLEELGLNRVADLRASQASRGIRRRAAIARALIHEPAIWLLDEPDAGLDDEGVGWLKARVERHCREGGVCCIATHHPRLYSMTGNVRCRFLRMSSGRLVDTPLPRPSSSYRSEVA